MIDDHTKANSELTNVAKARSLKVPDNTGLTHEASMKMLEGNSGAGFDPAHMKQMDGNRPEAVELGTHPLAL